MESVNKFFGENLKIQRTKHGLSRKELGDLLGVSEQALYYYENGKRETNFNTLVKLSDLFNVSVDSLLRPPFAQTSTPRSETQKRRKDLYNAILNLSDEKVVVLAELAKITSEIASKPQDDGSTDYNVTINVVHKDAHDTKED